MDMRILAEVELQPHHLPTDRTRHYAGGILLPLPRWLQVAQFGADSGYYLLYLDQERREITDTFHDTFDSAVEQAQFEFGIQVQEWQRPADQVFPQPRT